MDDFSRSNSLADLAAKARAEHEAIAAVMKRGLEHALTAGDILNEAKGQLKHGQWLPWLKSCGIPDRTGRLYMRLAANRANIGNVADISIRGAIALLSLKGRDADSASWDTDLRTLAASIKEDLRRADELVNLSSLRRMEFHRMEVVLLDLCVSIIAEAGDSHPKETEIAEILEQFIVEFSAAQRLIEADDEGCNDAVVTARNTLTSALHVARAA